MPHPITFTRRVVALLIALLLVSLVPAQAAHAQTAQRCFAETNQCISGAIRQYWERNGGLAVFGFPITAQSAETVEGRTLQVQWFERDRLEIQANGQVTAGRLGVERLEQQGTPWQYGPGEAADTGCFAFAETGHRTCGAFATYWQRNGGLERFGFPITGAYETEIQGIRLTVQYFERRRFELHDANTVLLGLLGAEVLRDRGGLPTPAPAPAPVVTNCDGIPEWVGDGGVGYFESLDGISDPEFIYTDCFYPTSDFGYYIFNFAPNERITWRAFEPNGQVTEQVIRADSRGEAFDYFFEQRAVGDHRWEFIGANNGKRVIIYFRVIPCCI
jgi:type II secretory pathway pseudopilin PulG